MIIKSNPGHVDTERIVLFPFDDHGLPFRNGVRLHLVGFKTPVDRTRIVVPLGEPGAPDSKRVIYYGTVLRVGGELWMWYLGQGDDDHWHQRVCLARSRDGYTWEKPDLGLVEYQGSRHNNLVDMLGGAHSIVACVVYHDPDDPDPERALQGCDRDQGPAAAVRGAVLVRRAALARIRRWAGYAAVRARRRHEVQRLLFAERARRQPLRSAAPVGDLPVVRLRTLDRGVVPGAAARRHPAAALPRVVRRWRTGTSWGRRCGTAAM